MKRTAFYKRLVRRYIDNKATDREKEVFFHLLSRGKLDRQLHAAMKASADQQLKNPSDNQRSSLKLICWYAAAAILTGLLITAGFYWTGPSRRKSPTTDPSFVSSFKNEIKPGGDHAILTLANGQQLVLDSAQQGLLGQQGNTSLLKATPGSMVYKAAGHPAAGNSGNYYNTIATPAGGQFQVTLSDGTRVWLNALSSIRFPTAFTGSTRTVELSGEAYFEVAKDRSSAFHVLVGGADIQVLGTHFNVNAYSDESALRTTLLEGAVRLVKGNASLLLAPGQQGLTNPTGSFSLIEDADTDAAIAWKEGYFSFDDADIQTVMRQLARWYGIHVKYQGPPTKALFWGKIGRDLNLTQALSGLDKSKVHFQLDGNTLTVLP